jgi:hypothetical protein
LGLSLRRNVGQCLPQYKASHGSRNIHNCTMFSMKWKVKITSLQHVMKTRNELSKPQGQSRRVWKREILLPLPGLELPDPFSPVTVAIPTTLIRAPVCLSVTRTNRHSSNIHCFLSLSALQHWQHLYRRNNIEIGKLTFDGVSCN